MSQPPPLTPQEAQSADEHNDDLLSDEELCLPHERLQGALQTTIGGREHSSKQAEAATDAEPQDTSPKHLCCLEPHGTDSPSDSHESY